MTARVAIPIDEKSLLFVCGCPRSGTTALWQMLMASTDIFLGVERFASFMARRNIGTLEASHYRKDRFFHMRDGDTHYNDLSRFHVFTPYFDTAKADYDKARLIGDKIPRLYTDFNNFGARFPNAKVIFIIRNIFDVCLSYQRRKENKSDSWSLDHVKAVQDWNEGMERYEAFASNEFSGLVIEYESLFNTDETITAATTIEKLANFTGIQDKHTLERAHSELLRDTPGLESDRRSNNLDANAKRHLLLNANIEAYKRLVGNP